MSLGLLAPRLPLLLASAMIGVTASVCVGAAEDTAVWFLRGKIVYVAPDVAPIADGIVLVRGGKIAAVGSKGEISLPANARESACKGEVIAAGFQNSHVHFTAAQFNGARGAPPEVLAHGLTQMLTRYGFTTVVDTGSDRDNTLALRSRIERGEVQGPRILTVGLPLYPSNGIPFYLADLPKALLTALPQPATPQDGVNAVRENLDAGADGTKLFVATLVSVSQGNRRSIKRMAAEIARAAVDATHSRGKLAMVHPTDIEGIRAALAARADILVHTTLDDEAAWPEPLVRQLVEQSVAVVPTLKLWRYELNKGKAPDPIKQMLVATTLGQLRAFAAAGGQVLFGTDVGYMTDFDPTEEYQLMSQAGLTPMQILESLTAAPAARWQESERRGRLVAGMDADIVVLEADPALDSQNFSKVRCAIRSGTVIYANDP